MLLLGSVHHLWKTLQAREQAKGILPIGMVNWTGGQKRVATVLGPAVDPLLGTCVTGLIPFQPLITVTHPASLAAKQLDAVHAPDIDEPVRWPSLSTSLPL